jgi:hypothetical protein
LSKEVSVALWLLLFRCGKALEVFWVFGEFMDKVGMTGFPCLREAKSNRSSLTSFRCVCAVAVGWVLLLGSVALQWLRELGKRNLRRCTSEIGFIARILE